MNMGFGVFFTFIVIFLVLIVISSAANAAKRNGAGRNTNMRRTVSSDGHAVPRREDLTCDTNEGHHHPEESAMAKEFGPRYIVHDEPEEGYVILNGVKRKLTDCSKY